MSPDHETQRVLGQLQGAVAAIQRQLDDIAKKSAENRGVVHKQLEAIRSEAQESRRRIERIEKGLEEDVHPVVRSVVDLRARAAGALLVLGVVGAVFLKVFYGAWDLALEWWRGTR